jgi:hypothetical protein
MQAEQVARVIWSILDRAKRVKALRRVSLLAELARGRERLRAIGNSDERQA